MKTPIIALATALAVAGGALAQTGPRDLRMSPDVTALAARIRAGDSLALQELMRLAETGRTDAQAYAGVLVVFSEGAPPALRPTGCRYLEKAASSQADAMHFLGEAYQHGRCGPKDLDKAIATFRKAGDMGSPKSRCAEGNLLLELGRDRQRAVALCREGAEAGDRDAQTDLANFYLAGEVVTKDVAEARRWYEQAAAQRQPNAAVVLGQIYWNADGVARDVPKAKALWLVAYEEGRTDAAFMVGNAAWVMSQRGEKTWDAAGLEEAAGWYDKAAQTGPDAQKKEAAERRDLARQLAGVMRRQGR